MKGLFIPEITAEMFRNGCLESIEALMAEGEIYDIEYSEDCISRKLAQNRIKEICNQYRLSYEDGERKPATGGSAYALGHAFDDLPPASSMQMWTPISKKMPDEKLPRDFQRVLITVVNYVGDKVVRAAVYINLKRMFRVEGSSNIWKIGEKGLFAWKPLPEPYRPKESEGKK